jgi:hypothetical protein
MKTKSLVPAAVALTLSLPAFSSIAATPPPIDLLGDPASPAAADNTITITPDTRYVNVEGGQVVKFDVGGKTFAWNFNGAQTVDSFDLNRVAPPGMLDREVRAYVSPNPLYIGS